MPPRTSDSYPRIYAVVSRIPRGRVANYGQVAALAGLPRQARLVGYALRTLPADSDVPWHRVVNAQGKVSPRGDGLGHEDLQEAMLRREGVRFVDGVIPFDRFQWRPRAPVAAISAAYATASSTTRVRAGTRRSTGGRSPR